MILIIEALTTCEIELAGLDGAIILLQKGGQQLLACKGRHTSETKASAPRTPALRSALAKRVPTRKT